MMSLTRRIAAVTIGVLLLQLSLLGSGAPCAIQGGHAISRRAHSHHMVASNHAPAHGWTVTAQSVGQGTPGGCAQHMGNGCDDPWAPGSCASMTACAVTMTVPAGQAAVVRLTLTAALPEPLSVKSDLTIAPELPPPRA